jgi:hypothetical protein
MVTTRRKAPHKLAFDQFVALVKDLAGVRHVLLSKGPPLDLTTYVDEWDEDLLDSLADAEVQLLNDLLEIEMESHVIALEGRDLGHWDVSDADLVFSR